MCPCRRADTHVRVGACILVHASLALGCVRACEHVPCFITWTAGE